MIPPIANRFVAGETIAEALEQTEEVNGDGLSVILNQLGEHYDDPAEAAADRDEYCQLIRDIDAMGVDACVSVKPTQLGLANGFDRFTDLLGEVLAVGDEHNVFVWIDMEDISTTDDTLDAYEMFVEEYPNNVGLCLQANLKRTTDDLKRLAGLPGKLRLTKGAYKEPAEVAYRDKARIDEAYEELIDLAFDVCDDGIAIGSHDSQMIDLAIRRHEATGTPFEIQMLMGVREGYQRELAEEYEVYQYMPYGTKWISYFTRRMLERKENVLFGLRAILQG